MPEDIKDTATDLSPSEVVLLHAREFVRVRRIRPKITMLLLNLFLILVGGVGLYLDISEQVEARKFNNWPQTTAEITQFNYRMTDSSQNIVRYAIDLEYRYKTPQHDSMTGYCFYFSTSHTSSYTESELSRLTKLFPEGKIVPVYYDPDGGNRSFLIQGAPNGAYVSLPVFYLMFLLGCYFFARQINPYLRK